MVVQPEQLERTGLSCGMKATAFFYVLISGNEPLH